MSDKDIGLEIEPQSPLRRYTLATADSDDSPTKRIT